MQWSGWPERRARPAASYSPWPLVWPVRLGAMAANSNGCARRFKHTGRVLRDLDKVPEGKGAPGRDDCAGEPARRSMSKDKKKLYSCKPAVCISEFGTITTNRGGFVFGIRCRAIPVMATRWPRRWNRSRPSQTSARDPLSIADIVGVEVPAARSVVYREKLLRRRSAIEPMIGHMKNDGRLRRSTLKGTQGAALLRATTLHPLPQRMEGKHYYRHSPIKCQKLQSVQ